MIDTRVSTTRGDVVLSGLRGGTEGDLVVLLHGLAGSAAEMAPVATAIRDRGFRVLALDQRGHGHSTRRPDDVSRAAFVADVLHVTEGEPAWLVGQSMGAHTAMLVAASGAARGLVMIEGGVGGAEPGKEDYPAELGRWFASWPVPFADEAAARAFLGDEPIVDAWIDDLERTPDGLRPRFDADVMEAIMRPVAAAADWAAWERITVPALVILGERGTQDRDQVRRMGAETIVVPDAGHDVHLDQPRRTVKEILNFIAA